MAPVLGFQSGAPQPIGGWPRRIFDKTCWNGRDAEEAEIVDYQQKECNPDSGMFGEQSTQMRSDCPFRAVPISVPN